MNNKTDGFAAIHEKAYQEALNRAHNRYDNMSKEELEKHLKREGKNYSDNLPSHDNVASLEVIWDLLRK